MECRESTLVSPSLELEKVLGHMVDVPIAFSKRGLLIVLGVFGRVKVLGHAGVKDASRRSVKRPPPVEGL